MGLRVSLASLLVGLALLSSCLPRKDRSRERDRTEREDNTLSPMVPDVSGLTGQEAKSELEDVGFRVSIRVVDWARAERGVVVDQKPAPGKISYIGKRVRIYVNMP